MRVIDAFHGCVALANTRSAGNTTSMLNDILIQRVSAAIRFMQADAQMTRPELAKAAGMSLSAVSRRFTSETPMSLEDLQALARAMGFEVSLTFTPKAEVFAA